MLVGPAQAAFIGKLSERCVGKTRRLARSPPAWPRWSGGAEMVRVHDVAEVAQAIRVGFWPSVPRTVNPGGGLE